MSKPTPSVNSSSVLSVDDSSTLTTPSVPTFDIASPTSSPTVSSRDETVATCAMASLPDTGMAAASSASDTASAARLMPTPSESLVLRQGQLVLLSDHINHTGRNPVAGPNDERLGPRFFDMTNAYSERLRLLSHTAAEFAEGVYLGLSGPSYETAAEIRAFRSMGADMVGMSTVHEVIVARHMGIEVLGISCVTNMAAGILDQPINHQEVMETGARVQAQLTSLLVRLLPALDGRI